MNQVYTIARIIEDRIRKRRQTIEIFLLDTYSPNPGTHVAMVMESNAYSQIAIHLAVDRASYSVRRPTLRPDLPLEGEPTDIWEQAVITHVYYYSDP